MADQQAVPSYVTCFGEPKAKGRLAKSGNDQRCLGTSRHSMTTINTGAIGCNTITAHKAAHAHCQSANQPPAMTMLSNLSLCYITRPCRLTLICQQFHCVAGKKEEIFTSRRSFRLCQTQCRIRCSITFLMPDWRMHHCIECRWGFGITHFKLASRARYTNL